MPSGDCPPTPDAMIVFESHQYTVKEGDVAMVNVCVHVQHPQVSCEINFPFSVILQTSDSSAGITILYITKIHGMLMKGYPLLHSSLVLGLQFNICHTYICSLSDAKMFGYNYCR